MSLGDRIAEFKVRIGEDRTFCEELYRYATVRLLAHKYAYYTLNTAIHSGHSSDVAYDGEELSWRIMGQALGHLKEDETSPCIDWDASHPLASEGIELANRLLKK